MRGVSLYERTSFFFFWGGVAGVTFGYISLVYKFCNGSTTVSMLQCIAHILAAEERIALFITHGADGLALPSLNRTLTSSILLLLGIAQTCLALLSLNRKIDITYPLGSVFVSAL